MQEREANELDSKAATAQTPMARKPLRLWPGVIIAIVLGLVRYGLPLIAPDAEVFGLPLVLIAIFGGMLGAVAIVVWWLFFSRAPWAERVGALVLMIVAVYATRLIIHESIRGGMMGGLLFIYSVPVLGLALVVWAVATRRLSAGVRRVSLVAAILLACAPWTLLRTAGSLGAGSEFHWRWTPTPEQRLLAQANDEPKLLPAATPELPQEPLAAKPDDKSAIVLATPAIARPVTEKPAAWPGFRGSERDSVIRGVQIKTDWSVSPPVELWRKPIGPGWSSFAVRGELLYTQEQRGEDELVGCYKISTGEPVWRHRDAVRFWESNAGAGPRATPTLDQDRVYAFGATGILNALEAGNGKVVWSRNVASDTGRKVPEWGFASSAVVVP